MLKDLNHLILWKRELLCVLCIQYSFAKNIMFQNVQVFFWNLLQNSLILGKCWACCKTLQYLCRVTEPFKLLFVSGKKYISYKLSISLLNLGCFKDIVDSLVGFPICPFQFKLGSYLNSMITSWKLFYSWTVLYSSRYTFL